MSSESVKFVGYGSLSDPDVVFSILGEEVPSSSSKIMRSQLYLADLSSLHDGPMKAILQASYGDNWVGHYIQVDNAGPLDTIKSQVYDLAPEQFDLVQGWSRLNGLWQRPRKVVLEDGNEGTTLEHDEYLKRFRPPYNNGELQLYPIELTSKDDYDPHPLGKEVIMKSIR